ncbi:hypothetical protein GR197_01940 [Rhizobium phaseoli]|uniref:Uncharacterized protein n=1 Tax=Rhizobium phaseoli TaxID=396 RepID=A0A7K3U6R5_9HYPH|nr:hypothetical protein [Rhizobium phaseoli]NEJ69306.1 hypothetical protein [Rhizobium phaseoli]
MPNDQALELWVIQRAQEILKREGLILVNAAQWLDKKGTVRGGHALREAIETSLREALRFKRPETSAIN